MDGGRLPGVRAEADPDRIVCHVDVDCFYAACERLREPALEGEPVVVGMGYEDGAETGAVATASYEAREHGVESAMAISTALERLPRAADDPDGPAGHYRPVDMAYYESVASDVKAILRELSDTLREVSVDEAYLDVTSRTDWSVVEGFARHVRQRVRREVGVTASVGVAPTMSAAKVASDHDKPDGLVVVEPGEVQSFLAPLPVEEVHGVGPVTARELREMGVETAGDLADADPAAVESRFGERGRALHRRARGVDDREVEPRGRPKSLSRESAFPEATTDADERRERVRTLASAVADRARRKDALYRTVTLKAVTPPYEVHTRAESFSGPVDDPDLVASVALDLLAEFDGEPVRKLGVRVSKLSFAAGDQKRLDGFAAADGAGEADGVARSTDGGANEPADENRGPSPDANADRATEGNADDANADRATEGNADDAGAADGREVPLEGSPEPADRADGGDAASPGRELCGQTELGDFAPEGEG